MTDSYRYLLKLAYDGTRFHGFANQPNQRTVAGEVTRVIEVISGESVELTCAGRTDKGVHALGQVVNFDLNAPLGDGQIKRWVKSFNSQLGPEISVIEMKPCDRDFSSRFDAISRTYRYLFRESTYSIPWESGYVWHVGTPLNRKLMRLGADPLIGEHDFSAFCKKSGQLGASMVRKVLDYSFTDREDELLEFNITSTSFCHQMVRSLVGLLVDVGLGKRKPSEVKSVLDSHRRESNIRLAPSGGLYLLSVRYDIDLK